MLNGPESEFTAALKKLADPQFWENESLWAEIAENLPSYRLSKFQPLMPPWVEREVMAGYLLDVEGARRWVSTLTPRRYEPRAPLAPTDQ